MSSNVRSPGASVLIGGAAMPGLLAAEVVSTSHLAAGRFTVRACLSLAGGPILGTGDGDLIEIRFGSDGAWMSALLGAIDRIEVDPLHDEVTIEGRDLTARFIGQRTQESFENRTTTEIVTLLALRRGLVPAVLPLSSLSGRYFQDATSRTTLNQHARATTEWDLLTWLAETEGCDVWVEGSVLNFTSLPPGGEVMFLTQADCLSLQFEKRLDAAGGGVLVRSWNCSNGQVVEASAGAQDASFVVVRPNLTPASAQSLAMVLAAQVLPQTRRFSLEAPGDLVSRPRGLVDIGGTNSEFDTRYVLTEVERRFSLAGGFVQTMVGREATWTSSSI